MPSDDIFNASQTTTLHELHEVDSGVEAESFDLRDS